ncbi:MAG: hypothetical protein IH859_05665, partial [Chloroflexi bacterium]|nr:hypothetical protein [Chloroflexota bacterium]
MVAKSLLYRTTLVAATIIFVLIAACTPQLPTVAGPLGDWVWLDSNGDGLQDDAERGVKDVKVELF